MEKTTYAVIRTGGKLVKVEPLAVDDVEPLQQDRADNAAAVIAKDKELQQQLAKKH